MKNLKKTKVKMAKKQVKKNKEERKKKEAQEIVEIIDNKLNVIEDKQLPALEAVPISGDTIEYWITPLGRAKIQAWSRNGLSKNDIALNMGISYSTLNRWENDFSLIRKALREGKDELTLSVENSLIKRALGYDYTERQVTLDSEGKETIRETTKHVAPEFQSIQYFLNNMKPDQWKSKQDVNVDATVQGKFTNMTDEELNKVMDKFSQIVGDGQ